MRPSWLFHVTVPVLSFSLFACGGSNAAGPTERSPGDASTDVLPDGGTSEVDDASDGGGGARTDAETDASDAPIVVLKDLTLPGHVHPFDVFAPKGAKRVVVFLHGGLGKKNVSPNQIGVTQNGVPDEAWLRAKETAFLFPQGSAIPQAPTATTWTNYVMTSGQDDVAFLTALQAALRAGTVDAALSAIGRVYVAGHSNGGMMANRLWCEASTSFDGFAAFAGPASVALHPTSGSAPCAPVSPKPYLGVIGSKDETIQTTSEWQNDVWTIHPSLTSGPSFVNPNVINEETFHRLARVPAVCNEVVGAPTIGMAGKTLTWRDCAGKVELVRVTNADHCLTATPACTNSLEAASGSLRDRLVDFFIANE